MKQWYEELFENYANSYENEVFTKGTIAEVNFLEQELNENKQAIILDVGCGTGRHSIELAKRGYRPKGVDLSTNMLQKAKDKAEAAGVKIDFEQADARNLPFYNQFDMVIMLCEGGFSLMETDEMNFEILKNCSKALKKGGTFIFTCLNALFPVYNSIQDFLNENDGTERNQGNTFDPMTLRDSSNYEHTDDSGNVKWLKCSERFYMPTEIKWYLKTLGFSKIEIFGCNVGEYSRNVPLSKDNFEMLVVAQL